MSAPRALNDLANTPRGFRIEAQGRRIFFRHVADFGDAVKIVWVVFVVALAPRVPNPVMIVFLSVAALIATQLVIQAVGSKIFVLDSDRLVIEHHIFGLCFRKIVPLNEIKEVSIARSKGSRRAHWRLLIRAEKDILLFAGEPVSKTAWLGPILAEWAGVRFRDGR